MIESGSENEEKKDYYEEEMEERSDDSLKRRKMARKLEKEKKKRKEYEDAMYERYLAEKTHTPVNDGEDNNEDEEDEDEDLQGPYATSDSDDGKVPYYIFDELNYTSDNEDDSDDYSD
ncbi:RNA polymerase II subunit 5-mediating protein homolog [Papaver somniferum]|uniref:RNA polymerase II subunit 5-mediating protein homolog n=1 Tax=Papaver somniferum TaxID=3469 RepID=UPI000E7000E6|nr:RNA polymerase II subunit 5-mediating protein homolog [Papaver somniferum]